MKNKYLKALKTAFPYTIPIFAGFWFLGLTYGIYMNTAGFSFWYPCIMSLTIFAGSIEFVTVNMLVGAFNPLQAFLMAIMINARHLFYGISMLDKYKNTGLKKLYLIFGMCDESFSINYTADIPKDVDRGWFMFFCNAFKSFLLVFGFYNRRTFRLGYSFQYTGAGICNDGNVRCYIYGTVDERKKPYKRIFGTGIIVCVPYCFRIG